MSWWRRRKWRSNSLDCVGKLAVKNLDFHLPNLSSSFAILVSNDCTRLKRSFSCSSSFPLPFPVLLLPPPGGSNWGSAIGRSSLRSRVILLKAFCRSWLLWWSPCALNSWIVGWVTWLNWLMPCPYIGPKCFWSVQTILDKYKYFWTGTICFGRFQTVILHKKWVESRDSSQNSRIQSTWWPPVSVDCRIL